MKQSKNLIISSLLVCCFVSFGSEACDSVFAHRQGQMKDGRIETIVEDDFALDSYQRCIGTYSEKGGITKAKGAKLKVSLKARNFSKKQLKKLKAAVNKMVVVINSIQFQQKVLAHKYNGKNIFANTTLNNKKVYNKIQTGAESLNPKKDFQMNLDLTLYYEDTNVVGYTYPSTNRIWVNSKYFNKFDLASVAGNVTHEWLHKIGFGHDYEATARRPYSVPYGVGYIMRSLMN